MTDLEKLVAIEAIRNLQSRYVRLADSKDWLGLAHLFLPQGSFVPYGVDGKPQVAMLGREQICRMLSDAVGAGTAIHHLFSYEIEIRSPTRAHGIWAMEDWVDRSRDHGTAAAPFKTLHGLGHYHVDYEKVDDAWFIANQKLYRTRLELTR
ncbi:MAG TPA: nuclear transport factor 2 family protein [Povalibacter sp.]|uniref:nuclear transport factor 2 family protein n=1 Tax=Povalibacter sp. TaxID=1962978 RepID=UPI002CA12EAD|nr:nuclear transport factor 2 family protein [Povalibacter sp.]HMN47132.1 nuclear transport factor 2 family protein [Povalibacter sp.]